MPLRRRRQARASEREAGIYRHGLPLLPALGSVRCEMTYRGKREVSCRGEREVAAQLRAITRATGTARPSIPSGSQCLAPEALTVVAGRRF